MAGRPSIQLRIAAIAAAAGAIILISTLVRGGSGRQAPTPAPPALVATVEEAAPPTEEPAPEQEATAQLVPVPTERPTAAPLPTERTTDPAGAPPLDKDNCPPEYPIKGNIGDDGRFYHVRGSRSYAATDPEICFATAADAVAAGFERPSNQ